MTSPALRVPELSADTSIVAAALAYADAGWYVLPIDPAGKHAGSLVGRGWPHQSSRDAGLIRSWWQRWPAAALAVHVGRSGAVVFDVDNSHAIPAVLRSAIAELAPPFQSTRTTDAARGHYVFAAEPGRFGNSAGDLGGEWGEVRGLNGIVVVEPTPHSKTDAGGRYRWVRTGSLPAVPPELAAALRPPGAARGVVDDAAVLSFLAALPGDAPCQAVDALQDELPDTGRHNVMLSRTLRLVRLGEQGHRGAGMVLEDLQSTYVDAVHADRPGGASEAEAEYARAVAGAVAEVLAKPTPASERGCCGGYREAESWAALGFDYDALAARAVPASAVPTRANGAASMLFPPPSEPLAVARVIETDFRDGSGELTLRSWRGGWVRYRGSHWSDAATGELETHIYARLEHASYLKPAKNGIAVPVAWAPNRRLVGDILHALASITRLNDEVNPPSWLSPGEHAAALVSCANGLLDVRDRRLLPHDPAYFNRVAVPFDYDPDAPSPAHWLEFLVRLWGDDPESIDALQDWCGYVLSGRTNLQKIFAIVGPKRSGKGTIARVLRQLVGERNYAGPTLASLGQNFGLQTLIGVPLAVVSDARLGGRDPHIIVERLLSISGEDAITVDRKYQIPWTGRLPTRFMMLSNEVPSFRDASAAIASRFLVLSLRESWIGREDTELELTLMAELPGILNWALDGLARVTARGRLTEPASSVDTADQMAELASPHAAFVRDACSTGPEREVEITRLFAAWKGWCLENGRDRPGTVQNFMRDLRAALPSINTARPRVGGERVRTVRGLDLVRGGPRPVLLSAQSDFVSPNNASSSNNKGDRGPSRTTEPGCISCNRAGQFGLSGRCPTCRGSDADSMRWRPGPTPTPAVQR